MQPNILRPDAAQVHLLLHQLRLPEPLQKLWPKLGEQGFRVSKAFTKIERTIQFGIMISALPPEGFRPTRL